MKIENVNKGVCQRRLQEGRPAFFVNYRKDGANEYEYFATVSAMYSRYILLQCLELL